MKRRLADGLIRILLLGGVLFLVSIVSLCVGPAGISFGKILSLILKGSGTTEFSIIFDIRFPRIILGFAIGGSLAISGVILQGMFRNPLVEPYTLGISGGAALGVCLSIILGLKGSLGALSIPLAGFLGAISVILAVYFLGAKKGILKIQGLLLTGVMISFISSSLIMLIMALSRIEDLRGIIFWTMGSLGGADWFLIKIVLTVAILGIIVASFYSMDLNAFSLGEEEALHLGINIERTKKLLFVLASLLTGISVSVSGIIGFVGLVVPHFVRMLVGSDHRILLISSFLCGGAFLIFCDTLARTVVLPLELPVGVITGILGGSVFVYALAKRRSYTL